ncbi:MAG: hypothetical protein WA081_07925 [Desulfosalsimonadaceae bacterium]
MREKYTMVSYIKTLGFLFCLMLISVPSPLMVSADQLSGKGLLQNESIQAASSSGHAIPWSGLGAKATEQAGGRGIGITATDAGANLECLLQRLEGEVTAEGLSVTSTAEDAPDGRFMVKASGISRNGARVMNFSDKGEVTVNSGKARFSRPGIMEEYSSSADGIRQDFIIPARPEGSGVLSLHLSLSGATAAASNDGVALTMTASRRELVYNRLHVTDASGKALSAQFRVQETDGSGMDIEVDDTHAVYPVRIDPTIADADWLSLNQTSGAGNGGVYAIATFPGSIFIGGSFTTVSGSTITRVARWDGTNWNALGAGISNGTVYALALNAAGTRLYAGGSFTTALGAPGNYIAQWDIGASTWSAMGTGVNGAVRALTLDAATGFLYAGGSFTTAGGGAALRVARWNTALSTWSALGGVGAINNGIVYALAFNSAATTLYAGGTFTSAGGSPGNRMAQWDTATSTWSGMGTGMDNTVWALAVNAAGTVYAGGAFTTAGGVAALRAAQWNGAAWSALGGVGVINNGIIYALALNAAGTTLYAGGTFTTAGGSPGNYIAGWDGAAWSALGTGMNNTVYALTLNAAGTLYAGGSFTTAGGLRVNRIAGWDGAAWSLLGAKINNTVYAIAVDAPAGLLYAGGSFTNAGGATANRVARWNGTVWSALGTGMSSNTVYALALNADGTILYAGGSFASAGGVANTLRIAQWNTGTSTWGALSTGLNNTVRALAFDAVSGSLYAGGAFTNAGSAQGDRIVRWDGAAWNALGTGINNNTVYALALNTAGTILYAGGNFTSAGGVANTNRVAQWDGAAWIALGTGVSNNTVYALALNGSETILYAGGNFTAALGAPGDRIIQWDIGASTWSALGSGISNNTVYALAFDATSATLYVGGNFTVALGAPGNRIAQWNTGASTWSALGSGTNNIVYALETDTFNSLYAGGSFTTAGLKVSPYIAECLVPYTVTFQTDGTPGATLTGTTPQLIHYGANGSPVTANPPPGYVFSKWTRAGVDYSISNPLTVTAATSDMTLTAVFATSTITLNITKAVTDENGGNLEPGDILLYTVNMQNPGHASLSGAQFTDAMPADTAYIAASATAPLGSTILTESPTLDITGINVAAHSQATVTFRVQLDNPLGVGVTQISNQGTTYYDSDGNGGNDITQLTDGDTVTPGPQPTIMPVTSGPNFSQTTKSVALQVDADMDGAVTPDDTLRYTVVIPNTGNQDAAGVAFVDVIPVSTAYVNLSVTATSGTASYNAGLGQIEWNGDVDGGNSVTITFDVTVNTGITVGTVISNQGTVSYDSDNNGSNDSTMLTDSDLAGPGRQPTNITTGGMPYGLDEKSVLDENGGNLEPGDTLLYTIVMKNLSGYAVSGTEFADATPNNTTYIPGSATAPLGSTIVTETPTLHITGINCPAHSLHTITFRVLVDSPLAAGVTQISNQGSVFCDSNGDGTNDTIYLTDGDTVTPGNQATILPVTAGPNFDQTTKSVALLVDADADGAVTPGDTLQYTVEIPNTGNQNAVNVAFTDPFPANTTYVAGSAAASDGTITDVGQIEWDGDVNAGDSVTITFDVTVNTGITVGTVISNQGTVSYDSDNNGSNDSTMLTDGNLTNPGRQTTDVTAGGVLQGFALKSVLDENGGNLVPGDTLLYTIVGENQSGFAINGIEFSDAIPNNTTYIPGSVSVPPGSTIVTETPVLDITGINIAAHSQVTVTFRVQVASPLPAGVTQISNQGTVFYDSDGDGINDSLLSTDGDTVAAGEQPTIIPVTAGPNFDQTTKSAALQIDADGNQAITPGDTLRYNVKIRNTGNENATGVAFTDAIPANTTYVALSVAATSGAASYNGGTGEIEWSGDVNVGALIVITFDVTVNGGTPLGTVISNQGTVFYDSDGDLTNDATMLTDSDLTTAGRQTTNLTIGGTAHGFGTKIATDVNGGNLLPGDILLYTIEIHNESGFDGNGIEFTDAIPNNTTYIAGSVTTTTGTVASETPVLTITGISIPAHTQITITFRVQVDNPAPAGVVQVSNQATVFYDSNTDGINDTHQQTDGDLTQPGTARRTAENWDFPE